MHAAQSLAGSAGRPRLMGCCSVLIALRPWETAGLGVLDAGLEPC